MNGTCPENPNALLQLGHLKCLLLPEKNFRYSFLQLKSHLHVQILKNESVLDFVAIHPELVQRWSVPPEYLQFESLDKKHVPATAAH